jgi:ABC-type nitrate/sulfonate/bicarbonate transport system substrate-binding protein
MGFLIGAKAIASAKDLKGKVVGISALGTATHFFDSAASAWSGTQS